MTEHEWRTSADRVAMMEYLTALDRLDAEGRVPFGMERKYRLLVCAYARHFLDMNDGMLAQVNALESIEGEDFDYMRINGLLLGSARDWALHWSRRIDLSDDTPFPQSIKGTLLRDIFGYPGRPVTLREEIPSRWPYTIYVFGPRWLTWEDGKVVQLAQAAYVQRGRTCPRCKRRQDWHDALTGDGKCFDCHGAGLLDDGKLDPDRLAILADALEEAGCTNEDILTHCRQPSDHVRGCWVIDLLLGKG